MTEWQQNIEAQISLLESIVPEHPDRDGFYGELYGADAADIYDATRSMQALLDVAVAAETMRNAKPPPYEGVESTDEWWDLNYALDKLREAGDEQPR